MYFVIKYVLSKIFPDKDVVKKPLTLRMRANNLALLVSIIAVSLACFPSLWFHGIIIADYFLPWKSFTSPMVHRYHSFLMSMLPDRPELPARELLLSEATRETLAAASRGFTVPVVIRGALKNSIALKQWTDKNWWLENYGDENVLCKYVEKIGTGDTSDPACTVRESFGSLDNKNGTRLYISGESKLFVKRDGTSALAASISTFTILNIFVV